MTDECIQVVAAVVSRGAAPDGTEVLLCQRHDGDHLPLLWEFPGGKIEPGEAPQEALARELLEELGVGSRIEEQLDEVFHSYPEKRVWIRFFRARIEGRPRARVHRRVDWVELERLRDYSVPPPNALVVERLISGELHIH